MRIYTNVKGFGCNSPSGDHNVTEVERSVVQVGVSHVRLVGRRFEVASAGAVEPAVLKQ